MNNSPIIWVSIDIGYSQHSVAIGLQMAIRWTNSAFTIAQKGLNIFLNIIYSNDIAVAMEGYNGYARPLDSLVRVSRLSAQ